MRPEGPGGSTGGDTELSLSLSQMLACSQRWLRWICKLRCWPAASSTRLRGNLGGAKRVSPVGKAVGRRATLDNSCLQAKNTAPRQGGERQRQPGEEGCTLLSVRPRILRQGCPPPHSGGRGEAQSQASSTDLRVGQTCTQLAFLGAPDGAWGFLAEANDLELSAEINFY